MGLWMSFEMCMITSYNEEIEIEISKEHLHHLISSPRFESFSSEKNGKSEFRSSSSKSAVALSLILTSSKRNI